MGLNHDNAELNEMLNDEGFKGDIPLEENIDNDAEIQLCEINYDDEMEVSNDV